MAESLARQDEIKSSAPARAPQGTVTADGTLAVYEPGTGKLVGEVRVSTAEQVRDAVRASRAAQSEWARRSFKDRRDVLLRFKELVLARANELCEHLARENGKTRNEALFMEVLPVADATHWYATHAHKVLADERIGLHLFPHKKSYVRYHPRGVIGIISPWNYPFSIPTGDAVAALMAGNGVVVKPSEYTPLILEKTRAMLEEAGLPRGLFGVVHGRGDVGAELIRGGAGFAGDGPEPQAQASNGGAGFAGDGPGAQAQAFKGVDMVVFTGSVATGRKVNVAAAERMIPCVLELGGKDPAIVLPDADVKSAAKKIAWGAFANAGQTCASVERVYVHESVAQPFTDEVVRIARSLRQGEPNQHEVDVGAMTTDMQVEIVRRHLDDAKASGAKVLAGGEIHGRFIQPTVLTATTADMPIVRDETFGPMLPIMTFRTEDEAVRLANDSSYGLSAYVFTRDRAKAEAIANRLEAGTVMHNDTLYTHAAPETPWGGVKSSGLGRVHGRHGMRDFCEQRHVNLERFDIPAFWHYPYSRKGWSLGLRVYRTVLGEGIGAKLKALFGRH